MARVLIADDASFMRQMIREIIEPEGHEIVGEATNGIEAVDLFKELAPELVTMDIVMPKRSGIDAVKRILAEHPTACIVMCRGAWAFTALLVRRLILIPTSPHRKYSAHWSNPQKPS